ncbi:MAG TPA: hypothetical protein PLW19_08195, partial [Anaerolineaceae bacterium]|nr:hypothetical protein [Anaerolineaceae bacterium]
MIKIKNIETGKSYTAKNTASLINIKWDDGSKYFRASEINRMQNAGIAELTAEHFEIAFSYDLKYDQVIVEKEATQKSYTSWTDEPASQKQLDYLSALGMNVAGKKFTKLTASRLIDSIKRGEGCGWM